MYGRGCQKFHVQASILVPILLNPGLIILISHTFLIQHFQVKYQTNPHFFVLAYLFYLS